MCQKTSAKQTYSPDRDNFKIAEFQVILKKQLRIPHHLIGLDEERSEFTRRNYIGIKKMQEEFYKKLKQDDFINCGGM